MQHSIYRIPAVMLGVTVMLMATVVGLEQGSAFAWNQNDAKVSVTEDCDGYQVSHWSKYSNPTWESEAGSDPLSGSWTESFTSASGTESVSWAADPNAGPFSYTWEASRPSDCPPFEVSSFDTVQDCETVGIKNTGTIDLKGTINGETFVVEPGESAVRLYAEDGTVRVLVYVKDTVEEHVLAVPEDCAPPVPEPVPTASVSGAADCLGNTTYVIGIVDRDGLTGDITIVGVTGGQLTLEGDQFVVRGADINLTNIAVMIGDTAVDVIMGTIDPAPADSCQLEATAAVSHASCAATGTLELSASLDSFTGVEVEVTATPALQLTEQARSIVLAYTQSTSSMSGLRTTVKPGETIQYGFQLEYGQMSELVVTAGDEEVLRQTVSRPITCLESEPPSPAVRQPQPPASKPPVVHHGIPETAGMSGYSAINLLAVGSGLALMLGILIPSRRRRRNN